MTIINYLFLVYTFPLQKPTPILQNCYPEQHHCELRNRLDHANALIAHGTLEIRIGRHIAHQAIVAKHMSALHVMRQRRSFRTIRASRLQRQARLSQRRRIRSIIGSIRTASTAKRHQIPQLPSHRMVVDQRQRKSEQLHKAAPDQLPGHVRIADITPSIAVHRDVIQTQHPIDDTRSLAGAQEPEEVHETRHNAGIIRPLLSGLQPFDVRAPKGGHIASVAQHHIEHVVQHQPGAPQLAGIVAYEEQLLAEGGELRAHRIVPQSGAQTKVEFGLEARQKAGLFGCGNSSEYG